VKESNTRPLVEKHSNFPLRQQKHTDITMPNLVFIETLGGTVAPTGPKEDPPLHVMLEADEGREWSGS